jgi:septum formation protein
MYRFQNQKKIPIILGSNSPRRREYLAGMGHSFTAASADVDERLPAGLSPRDGVLLLAERKAMALTLPADTLLIAADTLVEYDGVPLGKPTDRADAIGMLRRLSGTRHYVHTGVAVRYGEKMLADVCTTAVDFRTLSDEEIVAYVDTGEPMDKAGAYGIQGLGGKLVSGIDGEFDNVVGLPRTLLDDLLCKITGEDV